MFENDVKMYGTQAKDLLNQYPGLFENDVKMYGTQAGMLAFMSSSGLRMM